jgi:hypothetical protein
MPVEGSAPVQSPSPATAGTSDAAHGAGSVAGAVNQSRVADGFWNPQIPAELTVFDRVFGADPSTLQRAPVCRLGETVVPAWEFAAQSQVSGGATAKPTPASAAALVPIINLPFKNGILQQDSFEASLNKQLDSKPGVSIVDNNWDSASVDEVWRTYRALGTLIGKQADLKGVKVLFTNLVLPADQGLLNRIVSRVGGPKQEDMIKLMHEIAPSTVNMPDDALVRSTDYGKHEAYVACLGKAADGGIEVRALEPGATLTSDVGQYIILGIGTRAEIFDSGFKDEAGNSKVPDAITQARQYPESSSGILADRIRKEVFDPELDDVKAANLTRIVKAPGVTPELLAVALRHLAADMPELRKAFMALRPEVASDVATALAAAIHQIDDNGDRRIWVGIVPSWFGGFIDLHPEMSQVDRTKIANAILLLVKK